jgi:hypothetical protein
MRIAPVQPQQKVPLVGLLVYSFLLAIWALISIEDGRSSGWQLQVASLQVGWVVFYLLASFAYFRSMYLFSTAYLVVFSLFHMGLFWQYAFGFVNISEWDGAFGEWIYLAEWYAALALAGFGCGFATLCLMRKQVPVPSRRPRTVLTAENLKKLRTVGVGLMLASGLLFALALILSGNILKMSRFELFFKGDTRMIGVFTMIFPSAVLIMFVTARTARQRVQAYAFTAAAFIVVLLSGSRSTALFPALTGLIIWAKLGRRVPVPLLVAGVTFVLLAIPVIGYIRDSSYEQINMESIAKSSERADIGSALSELGGTIGVLAHTVKIVPDEEPFRYGYTYMLYFRQVLPNLGGEVNDEFSRRALKRDIESRGQAALFDMKPSDWASYHIIPLAFLQGAGTGFSAIGEAYLNFGSAGVIVIFALFGVLLAKLDNTLLGHNYGYLLFAAVFFCHFMPTVRNDFGVFIKPTEYTGIIILLWMLVLRFLPKARRKRTYVAPPPQATTAPLENKS